MNRRYFLQGLGITVAGLAIGCQQGSGSGPAPPSGPNLIRDTYLIKEGAYQVEVELQHNGSSVSQFFAKVIKQPGVDSVRKLLGEAELLRADDPRAVATMLGGQPLLKRVEVRPQGQRFRLEGNFWYKINGVLVLGAGENIDLARFIAPTEVMEVTLGDGLPATIV